MSYEMTENLFLLAVYAGVTLCVLLACGLIAWTGNLAQKQEAPPGVSLVQKNLERKMKNVQVDQDVQQEIERRSYVILEEMLGYSGPGFAMFREAIEDASRSNDDADFLSALQALIRDYDSADEIKLASIARIIAEYGMESFEAFAMRKAEEEVK